MRRLLFTLLIAALTTGHVARAAQEVDGASSEVLELRVETITGADFDLAAHRGKWVIINYWATWCSPCLKEMPDLDAFAKAHDNVTVIGLAYEDISAQEMQAFLAERPVSYPIAIVDVFDPPAAFPAPRGLPMTWLVRPDGQVDKNFLGPVTLRDLEQAIAAAKPVP